MEIETTRFGQVDVEESQFLLFPEGLLGFGEIRRFALIDHPGPLNLQWLQAIEVPELAFVVLDPILFKPDYFVQVRPDDLAKIQLEDIERGRVLVILVVPRDPQKITANLQGPLVINPEKGLALQIVLPHDRYSTQHPVFGEETEVERSATGNA